MRSNWEENSTGTWRKDIKIRLVIDSNILFAALITDNKTSELLFSEQIELYAPELLFKEFEKYKSTLLDKTKKKEQDMITTATLLKKRIILINDEQIIMHLQEAQRICPDEGDTPYFAAARALHLPIWSNDKRLKEQSIIKVVNTQELLEIL